MDRSSDKKLIQRCNQTPAKNLKNCTHASSVMLAEDCLETTIQTHKKEKNSYKGIRYWKFKSRHSFM